jgi:hypothetical protein
MVACATAVAVSSGRTQQPVQAVQTSQPYTQTMQFGAGYINTPVAWVSQRSSDWVDDGFGEGPSIVRRSIEEWPCLAPQLQLRDRHALGRTCVGWVLAVQPESRVGLFRAGIVVRDGDFGQSFMPAIAIGARNIGKFKHEDRFLIGHDVVLDSTGKYDEVVVPRYADFKTAPTLYAVMTKESAAVRLLAQRPDVDCRSVSATAMGSSVTTAASATSTTTAARLPRACSWAAASLCTHGPMAA